jgi:C-terminal processing protease CtpA/Prc
MKTFAAVLLFAATAGFAQPGPDQPDMILDVAARTAVIEGALRNINDFYVFPETAKKMDAAIRARIAAKEYDGITSAKALADKLTADLQDISKDKHLGVRYSHQPIPEKSLPLHERPEVLGFMKAVNYGFEKVERMPGNVGYVDLRGFAPANLGGPTAAAAMSFIANTDALIIDLRKNGGGEPAMVSLISSYLFGDEPVHLNDLQWREGNRTEQFWTTPSVPGMRFGASKPVYVLTSSRSFSAAEEFAYNLQVRKRATIIGETTGGGAHEGREKRINDHFEMYVPTARAINPVTRTNWEGAGVKPDVAVSADEALKTAHVAALRKNLESAQGGQRARLERTIDAVEKGIAIP